MLPSPPAPPGSDLHRIRTPLRPLFHLVPSDLTCISLFTISWRRRSRHPLRPRRHSIAGHDLIQHPLLRHRLHSLSWLRLRPSSHLPLHHRPPLSPVRFRLPRHHLPRLHPHIHTATISIPAFDLSHPTDAVFSPDFPASIIGGSSVGDDYVCMQNGILDFLDARRDRDICILLTVVCSPCMRLYSYDESFGWPTVETTVTILQFLEMARFVDVLWFAIDGSCSLQMVFPSDCEAPVMGLTVLLGSQDSPGPLSVFRSSGVGVEALSGFVATGVRLLAFQLMVPVVLEGDFVCETLADVARWFMVLKHFWDGFSDGGREMEDLMLSRGVWWNMIEVESTGTFVGEGLLRIIWELRPSAGARHWVLAPEDSTLSPPVALGDYYGFDPMLVARVADGLILEAMILEKEHQIYLMEVSMCVLLRVVEIDISVIIVIMDVTHCVGAAATFVAATGLMENDSLSAGEVVRSMLFMILASSVLSSQFPIVPFLRGRPIGAVGDGGWTGGLRRRRAAGLSFPCVDEGTGFR